MATQEIQRLGNYLPRANSPLFGGSHLIGRSPKAGGRFAGLDIPFRFQGGHGFGLFPAVDLGLDAVAGP
jgi:hypothetical protein